MFSNVSPVSFGTLKDDMLLKADSFTSFSFYSRKKRIGFVVFFYSISSI